MADRDETGGRPGRSDLQRASGTDRDPAVYARRRSRQARRRARLDHDAFDPTPPTDDDWVVEDRSELRRLPTGPRPLGDLLGEIVDDQAWGDRLRGVALFDHWDEVVGPELAAHCHPVRLTGGVLTVAASSSTWATQLRYLGGRLALNVNQRLGEPLVEQVNVVVRDR